MLEIIAGPAGSGKSRMLYERVLARAMEHPKKNIIVCTPEQYSLTVMRRIASMSREKGILNIDVLSFNRLAHRIFEGAGGDASEVLDDTGKNLILRRIASEKEQELLLLSANLKKMGYINSVKSVISEFMQYGIAPEDQERMILNAKEENPYLALKLEDLRLIFGEFERRLGEEYITREELLSKAAKAAHGAKFLQDAEICFDGFTGFTPVQYYLMEVLYRITGQVAVTVTDDGSGRRFFEIARKEEERLRKIGGADTKLTFLPSGKEVKREAGIYRCHDAVMETEHAIEQIEELVRQGYRYRDIGIILGDPGYGELLSDAAKKRGIPVFSDRTQGIAMNPLSELIRVLLQAVRDDFPYESMVHLMKTGLTGIDREKADEAENYIRALKIRGRSRYQRQWKRKYKGIEPETAEAAEEVRKEIYALLSPLLKLGEKAGAARITKALYEVLLKAGAEEGIHAMAEGLEAEGLRSEAMQYAQIYARVMQLFDQIADLLGEEEMSIGEYAELMDAGLSEIRLGTLPPGTDCIIAGDLLRSRFSGIRALFILGMNEGFVPQAPERGGLISDRDRDFLREAGFELAPTAAEQADTEQYYLYMNLFKPTDKLMVSYADLGPDMSERKPSYFLGFVRQEVPEAKTYHVQELDCFDRVRAMERLSEVMGTYSREAALLYRFFLEEGGDPERLLSASQGEPWVRQLGRLAAKLVYGGRKLESATELERYAACAYQHFLRYGLRLRERADFEFAMRDFGNVLHGILQDYAEGLRSIGRSFRDPYDEKSEEILSAVLENAGDERQALMFAESSRNAYMKKRMERVARRTIDTIQSQVLSGSFEPEAFEKYFEHEGLKGYIDRVDCSADGEEAWVSIIDYKSGNKPFDLDRIYYGLDLQLILYLSAALAQMEGKYGKGKVHPAGVFYYHVDDPLVEDEGEDDEELKHKIERQLRLRGMVNSDPEAIRRLDGNVSEKGKSDVIPVGFKSDGGFDAYSKVASEEELKEMMSHAIKRARQLAEGILSGNVSREPFELDGSTACDYCGYREICDGGKKRHLSSVEFPDSWKEEGS